jgi:hypothetical protein
LDAGRFYATEGREVAVLARRAEATVREFVAASAGSSGLEEVEVTSVVVGQGPGGPRVAVELSAETPVGLLGLLGIVPPRMVGGAAATARVVASN